MRQSTCYISFNNSTGVCQNPLSMELTNKLCCCSVGRGWADPSRYLGTDSTLCDACPAKGTGVY